MPRPYDPTDADRAPLSWRERELENIALSLQPYRRSQPVQAVQPVEPAAPVQPQVESLTSIFVGAAVMAAVFAVIWPPGVLFALFSIPGALVKRQMLKDGAGRLTASVASVAVSYGAYTAFQALDHHHHHDR